MDIKSFPVAILQGRLSPDTEGRYQFFPKEGWQKEFETAHQLGFDGLEWLIDPKDWEANPIFCGGYSEAEACAEKSAVPIVSICADWFMDVCIWEDDPKVHQEQIRSLLPQLQSTDNKVLLIPLLEKHTIKQLDLQDKVVQVLKPLASELEAAGVSVGFETELPARELLTFLSQFESDAFGCYYDIGNCTSYGFDCAEDIRLLDSYLKGVHVKDRKIGSVVSVTLGEGDADFRAVLVALTEIDWKGTLVMQAWRGDDYLNDAKTQLKFIRSFFNRT